VIIKYHPLWEDVMVEFAVASGTLEQLLHAIEIGRIAGGIFDHEDGGWFVANTSWGGFGVQRESDGSETLRVQLPFHPPSRDDVNYVKWCDVKYASHAPEWMWFEFVTPIKQILGALHG
jgi:hypothetical protein